VPFDLAIGAPAAHPVHPERAAGRELERAFDAAEADRRKTLGHPDREIDGAEVELAGGCAGIVWRHFGPSAAGDSPDHVAAKTAHRHHLRKSHVAQLETDADGCAAAIDGRAQRAAVKFRMDAHARLAEQQRAERRRKRHAWAFDLERRRRLQRDQAHVAQCRAKRQADALARGTETDPERPEQRCQGRRVRKSRRQRSDKDGGAEGRVNDRAAMRARDAAQPAPEPVSHCGPRRRRSSRRRRYADLASAARYAGSIRLPERSSRRARAAYQPLASG